MGGPMAGHLARAGHDGHRVQPHRAQGRSMGRSGMAPKGSTSRMAATPGRSRRRAGRGADLRRQRRRSRRRWCSGPTARSRRWRDGALFVDHTTVSADDRPPDRRTRPNGAACSRSTRRSRADRPAPRTASSRSCAAASAEAIAAARRSSQAYGSRASSTSARPAPGRPTKMVNQIAIAGRAAGPVGSACGFAQARGLDLDKVLEAISGGAAQSWQMVNRWQTMADGRVRFRLRGRLDAQGPRHRAGRRRRAGRRPAGRPRWSTGYYAEVQADGRRAAGHQSSLIRRLAGEAQR